MISFPDIKAEPLDSGNPDRPVHVSDYIILLHNLTPFPVKSDDKTLETSLTLPIFVVFLLSFTLLPYKEGPCD